MTRDAHRSRGMTAPAQPRRSAAAQRSSRTAARNEQALALADRPRQAMVQAVIGLGSLPADTDATALTVPRAAEAQAPRELSQSHPAGPAREQARAMYERCLAHYRDVVRPALVGAGASAAPADPAWDDVGAAAAFFVAANLQALHGETASSAALLALERQLAGVVRVTSAWAEAEARDKQLYFEKLAVLGVFMQELAAQAPRQGAAAVARVRQAAAGYVNELLGLDAAHLSLGDEGLRSRQAA